MLWTILLMSKKKSLTIERFYAFNNNMLLQCHHHLVLIDHLSEID
jgi:hypothetical protein